MASSFLIAGSGVKTKWQYLRDTYRRELAKTNQPTGSASGGDSKWKYFQLMSFLHDTYAPRVVVGNAPNPQQSDGDDASVSGGSPKQSMSHIDHELMNSQSGEQEPDELQLEEQQTGKSSCYSITPGVSQVPKTIFKSPKNKFRQKKDALNDLVQLEKVMVAHLQELKNKKEDEEKKDEDYFFVMSLLPYLRAIPPSRKLQMRIKLQQVLLECQSINQNSTSYNTSIPVASPPDYSNWSSSVSTSSQQSDWNTRSYSPSDVEPVQQTVNPDQELLTNFLRFKNA